MDTLQRFRSSSRAVVARWLTLGLLVLTAISAQADEADSLGVTRRERDHVRTRLFDTGPEVLVPRSRTLVPTSIETPSGQGERYFSSSLEAWDRWSGPTSPRTRAAEPTDETTPAPRRMPPQPLEIPVSRARPTELKLQPLDTQEPETTPDDAAGNEPPTLSVPLPAPTPTPVPTDAPSLEQRISRRYSDPRVLRLLSQLAGDGGEGFVRETNDLIDQRHLQPSAYRERVDRALENLLTAISNREFQAAARMNPSAGQLERATRELTQLRNRQQVRNAGEAVLVARRTADVMERTLGSYRPAVAYEFVAGALQTLDQYSMFVPPEKVGGRPTLGLAENMVGIGVELEAAEIGLRIVKVLPESPAAEAGLQRGDWITAVNRVPVAGVEMNRAADLLSGAEGTAVRLEVRREELSNPVTVTRRKIAVQSVTDVKMLDAKEKVAYIKLEQFAQSTAKELDAALWKLHGQGMQSLILDLRGNPGGLLTTAIEVADRFLPSGTIVSTRGRLPSDNIRESAAYANTWKVPLVVLIDHGSASASEIFAAAIQENERGLIVGETSYGKGTVQTLFPMDTTSGLVRLTTAKFYSPNGREMAGQGVKPDIPVASDAGGDGQPTLQAGIDAARDPRVRLMAKQAVKSPNALRTIRVAA